MATDDATDETVEEETDGKKKGGKLKFIIVGLLLVVGLGYFFFGRGGSAEAAAPTTTIPLSSEEEGLIITATSLTVNLANETPRFAKVGVAIVLVEGQDPVLAELKLPLVHDAILTEVSSMTAEQILSAEGFDMLRNRIGDRVRDIYNTPATEDEPEERVAKRVVLTELLVQ